jgi:hypothetical protein
MVGENLFVLGSNADEVVGAVERAAVSRPTYVRDRFLRMFLEKTETLATATVFLSGNFISAEQRDGSSLRSLLHIRSVVGAARVNRTAECHLTIEGDLGATEIENIRGVFEGEQKKDNPFTRFMGMLTKDGPKPERRAVVYEHSFVPADVSVVFPPDPANRR